VRYKVSVVLAYIDFHDRIEDSVELVAIKIGLGYILRKLIFLSAFMDVVNFRPSSKSKLRMHHILWSTAASNFDQETIVRPISFSWVKPTVPSKDCPDLAGKGDGFFGFFGRFTISYAHEPLRVPLAPRRRAFHDLSWLPPSINTGCYLR
jgi:hypothetical protein